MKELSSILLFILIVVSIQAQNNDSLKLDNYFAEQQISIEYLKKIDIQKTSIYRLQKEINEKNELFKVKQKHAEALKANLKLFNFLKKMENDSLKNFYSDTSEYTLKKGNINMLWFKSDVNINTLENLLGKNELKKQLPILLSSISKQAIKVETELISDSIEVQVKVSEKPLPDWPINNSSNATEKQLIDLYNQQEAYINEFCVRYNCGKLYWDLFKQRQKKYQYPKQVIQLINNQFLFKIFLDNECGK